MIHNTKYILLSVLAFFALVFAGGFQIANAATITSTATGNWTAAGTWDLGRAPISTDDVVIDNSKTVTYDVGTATTTINSLWVKSGSTLTHSDNSTAKTYIINLSVASTTIESGATVTANALGFDPGYGTGGGTGKSGGSYGGVGGSGAGGSGGTVYGSASLPVDLGSGGNGGTGGNGGGAILMTVSGTATVNGTISSNGQIGDSGGGGGGGGSGGTIYINAATLAGSGSMTADGKSGQNTTGVGGGGGGRIALIYTTSTYSGTLTASGAAGFFGGSAGSAGTIYPTFFYWLGTTNTTWATGSNWRGSSAPATTSDIAVIDCSCSNYPTISGAVGLAGILVGTSTASTLNIANSSVYTITVGSTYNFVVGSTTASTLNMTGTATTTIDGSLTIKTASNLTHSANSTTRASVVNLSVTGSFTLDSGGTINTNGLGYTGGGGNTNGNGPGPGVGGGNFGGGGGHGGAGGSDSNGTSIGGSINDNVVNPYDLGSGGAGGFIGGSAGGGAVVITSTGNMAINGTVSANGGAVSGNAGSGAGGTVFLTTSGALSGSGTITSNGGAVTGNSSGRDGSGGGGRIMLSYNSSSFTGSESVAGGTGDVAQTGGVGTIVLLNSNTNDITQSGIATFNSNTSYHNYTATSSTIYIPSGVTLTSTGTFTTQSSAVALSVTGTATFSATTVGGAFTLGGAGTFSGGAGTIQNGGTLTATSTTQRTFSSLTVQSGGNITHSANSTAKTHIVSLSITGNLDLQSGGTINVNSLGFTATSGTGAGVNNGSFGTGAGYGGAGGTGGLTGAAAGGTTYGSQTNPTDIGSGGANGFSTGGSGGGAVIIAVTVNATINGSISANGSAPSGNSGAGSGGTVNINVSGILSGGGTVTATGGPSDSNNYNGAGGGGRVAILYVRRGSSVPTATAAAGSGGNSNAGAGTVYLLLQTLVTSGGSSATQSTNPSLTTGLVGYWSFDGAKISGTSATDDSGSGNTGTLTNGPTPTIGRVGQALQFDGSTNYVSVADNASLRPSNITVSAWVYFPNAPGASGDIVVSKEATNQGYGLVRDSNSKLTFQLNFSGGAATCTGASTVSNNQWVFLVGTYDGATIRCYLNGAQDGTSSYATGITHSTGVLYINRSSGAPTVYLTSRTDDVRIYNRALSATEVKQLYTAAGSFTSGAGSLRAPADATGLVGYWSFNGPDLTTTTATDRSGQGNNGTLTNGPVPTIGKIGQALQFDGSNDFVSANGLVSTISTNNVGSVALWVNFVAGATGDSGNIFTVSEGSTANNYLQINIESNKLRMVLFTTSQVTLKRTTNTYSGVWHHLVVTSDGSTAKLYVDGTEPTLDTNTDSGNWLNDLSSLTALRIGGLLYSGTERSFNGSLDDVRVYNRALSASEITRLYNLGTATFHGSVIQ